MGFYAFNLDGSFTPGWLTVIATLIEFRLKKWKAC